MILTFKGLDNKIVSLSVRAIPGVRPEGAAPVYELLDQTGKPSVQSYEITVNEVRHFHIFDCVEVENGDVFAYSWIVNQRMLKIGRMVDQ